MTNRREFLQISGAAVVAAAAPAQAQIRQKLSSRNIPGTDELLAIVGLGNSRAFRNQDRETATQLLDIFIDDGGNYIDVGGPSGPFVGELAAELGATKQLFLATYVDPGEPDAMRGWAKSLAKAQGKESLDLIHTRDLRGYRENYAAYRALKDEGLVRYIGVARTGSDSHAAMAQLIVDGLVDFVQVNYSMLEPEAVVNVLPRAFENDVGVAISRPFLNGNYFGIVSGHQLPEWAAEFDCHSWAQFSLKYILGYRGVTCVLTETANPEHAVDNLGAGIGRLPDARQRKRMREHMLTLV